MKNNIIFTIVAGLFLTSCSRSYLAGIDPDSPFHYTRESSNLVAVGPNKAKAGERFWKKGVSIKETEKEYDACWRKYKNINNERLAHESADEFRARRRNYRNACMLKKGFAYMDRGININYDSNCQHTKSRYNKILDVCK